MNIARQLMESLLQSPDGEAICDSGGKTVTCLDLYRRTGFYRSYLQQEGLEPGQRVVLQIPNGAEIVAVTLAVILAGGVPVLVEPGCGNSVYLSQVRAARARWVLVHPLISRVNSLPGLRRYLNRRGTVLPPDLSGSADIRQLVIPSARKRERGTRSKVPEVALSVRRHDDEAVVAFTGGTTADPKGVRLTHGCLRYYLDQIAALTQEIPFNRLLAENLQQVLYALHLGKSACVVKGPNAHRARRMLHLIEKGQVDACFSSPYIWVRMLGLGRPSILRLPPTLKAVFLGGAPVTRKFLTELTAWLHPGTSLLVLYGMTETGPVCAIEGREKMAYMGEDDLVGPAVGTADVGIINPDPGTGIGEVVVSGPSLFAGYLGSGTGEGGCGFATGDLGRLRTIGDRQMLTLSGRKKDMIIRRGVNIYPALLEPLITQVSDPKGRRPVRECALVGIWNEKRQDEEVVLFVQPDKNIPWDTKTEALIKDACGKEGQPDRIVVVGDLPRIGRQNKIDKEALKRDGAARSNSFGRERR